MSQVGANELKRKMMIMLDGQPFLVLEVVFASPSARGASTMIKVKVRNLLNGAVLDKNFKSGEKFNEADVEKIKTSFLYSEPDACHFMDEASFEQFALTNQKLGELRGYLMEGMVVDALKYNGEIVSIELPVYVELKVVSTEPGAPNTGWAGALKPATLETGIEVRVPLYINEGDKIRVNTETGETSGRA